MSDELAYVLITPYSLCKSRTGGIISRVLAHTKLEFIGARMFVFSDEFLDAYKEVLCGADMDPAVKQAWHDYVDNKLRQDNPYNMLPRCMLLLFQGRCADNARDAQARQLRTPKQKAWQYHRHL